ncbi:MAG: aldehyde dehydrogenase family protein [Pseudomonas sp.]|nr:aldehyde dehydrogenase family protein [Pseudomonas sp.]
MSVTKRSNSLYINGEWVSVVSGASEPVINPATEEVIGFAPVGGKVEAEAAIAAARQAFDLGQWAYLSGTQRAIKLQAFYDALIRKGDEIRTLITTEAGATAVAQRVQFGIAMQHAQFFVNACTRDLSTPLPVEVNPVGGDHKLLGGGVAVREPVGVVVAITPYNFPFFLNVSKVFPALAAGNTVVLKPSPYTPFSALVLAQAAQEAGLPNGVLNVITGGQEVGEMLTSDPRVDLITFTGSDNVGAAIQAQAAPTVKRLLLELGGKSALIVCEDANLDQATASGVMNFTWHAGQGCNLTTRHIVHNSIRAQYVERVAGMASAMKVGNPADPSVAMGPLIRESQRKRVEYYVDLARQEGAELVTGGRRPEGLDKGFFYEPTLFTEVDNKSRIAQEEVFGPVGVVIGYDTDEEAIALANDSQYGLGGGIFSQNVGRAFEMAKRLRTGEVYLNGGSGGMSSHAPFGGIKRSGYGREFGIEGLNEYTYLKSIVFHAG